jgi:hypothetical protein
MNNPSRVRGALFEECLESRAMGNGGDRHTLTRDSTLLVTCMYNRLGA